MEEMYAGVEDYPQPNIMMSTSTSTNHNNSVILNNVSCSMNSCNKEEFANKQECDSTIRSCLSDEVRVDNHNHNNNNHNNNNHNHNNNTNNTNNSDSGKLGAIMCDEDFEASYMTVESCMFGEGMVFRGESSKTLLCGEGHSNSSHRGVCSFSNSGSPVSWCDTYTNSMNYKNDLLLFPTLDDVVNRNFTKKVSSSISSSGDIQNSLLTVSQLEVSSDTEASPSSIMCCEPNMCESSPYTMRYRNGQTMEQSTTNDDLSLFNSEDRIGSFIWGGGFWSRPWSSTDYHHSGSTMMEHHDFNTDSRDSNLIVSRSPDNKQFHNNNNSYDHNSNDHNSNSYNKHNHTNNNDNNNMNNCNTNNSSNKVEGGGTCFSATSRSSSSGLTENGWGFFEGIMPSRKIRSEAMKLNSVLFDFARNIDDNISETLAKSRLVEVLRLTIEYIKDSNNYNNNINNNNINNNNNIVVGGFNPQGVGGPNFSAPSVLAHPAEFKNASSFLKIYGDPMCANGMGAKTPLRGAHGNWICSKCDCVNFPRRFRCNKCETYRDSRGDDVVASYAKYVYEQHLRTYQALGAKTRPFGEVPPSCKSCNSKIRLHNNNNNNNRQQNTNFEIPRFTQKHTKTNNNNNNNIMIIDNPEEQAIVIKNRQPNQNNNIDLRHSKQTSSFLPDIKSKTATAENLSDARFFSFYTQE